MDFQLVITYYYYYYYYYFLFFSSFLLLLSPPPFSSSFLLLLSPPPLPLLLALPFLGSPVAPYAPSEPEWVSMGSVWGAGLSQGGPGTSGRFQPSTCVCCGREGHFGWSCPDGVAWYRTATFAQGNPACCQSMLKTLRAVLKSLAAIHISMH